MEISRPCITLGTKIAKAKFEAIFCLEEAKRILERLPIFSEVKVSARIGVLKTYGEVRMLLFEDGSVTIKPAKNPEEVYQFLKKIGMLLWGAQKCELIHNEPVCSCDRLVCEGGCKKLRPYGIPLENEID